MGPEGGRAGIRRGKAAISFCILYCIRTGLGIYLEALICPIPVSRPFFILFPVPHPINTPQIPIPVRAVSQLDGVGLGRVGVPSWRYSPLPTAFP